MPIELIPPQREGLHIGFLPVDIHWGRALRRLDLTHQLEDSTWLFAVHSIREALDRCDLVFELHDTHWRLVSPQSAPGYPGIWHAPATYEGVLDSALGAARWISDLLHRPPGSTLEFADVMLWLKDGGELMWRRVSEQPDCVGDVVMDLAEWWVNEHTAQQLLDLHMPRMRGARRRFMAIQQELLDLLPAPAVTWTPMSWEPFDEEDLPRASGYYMVLQRSPCGSTSPFKDLNRAQPS